MGRLAFSTCYLIGSMCRAEDGGVRWRKEIKPFLNQKGIFVIDPCDKPIDIGLEDFTVRSEIQNLKENGQYKEIRDKFGIIRNVDLHFVDRSSFVICSIDLNEKPCGSWEEIFLSNRQKKITLVHMVNGKKETPNWLLWALPEQFIFNTMEELKDYVSYVDESEEEPETYGRWKFIDHGRLLGDCIRAGFDLNGFIERSL